MKYERNDRAISEGIGFILIVSIILFSISLTFIGGLPTIEGIVEYNSLENSKQNMEIFKINQDKIIDGEVRSDFHTVKIQDSSIIIDNSSGIQIDSSSIGNGKIKHEINSMSIEYEFGAVIETKEDGFSYMHKKPDWLFTNDSIYIKVPNYVIDGGDVDKVSGNTRVEIVSSFQNKSITEYQDNVSLTINTSNNHAWESYFSELDDKYTSVSFDISDGGSNEVVLQIDNYNNLVVRQVNVEIKLD